MNLATAIKYAAHAHDGQFDKNGHPYIYHPMRVAETLAIAGEPEWLQACGILHDVVEDTSISHQDLEVLGLTRRQSEVLRLVTHARGEPYLDYVYRIGDDRDAATLKLADMRDNLQLWRLQLLTPEQRARAEAKYPPAIQYLEGRVLFDLSHDEVQKLLANTEAPGGPHENSGSSSTT
jgi:(p)ppGpp synthase/HD superfamily hydrolase